MIPFQVGWPPPENTARKWPETRHSIAAGKRYGGAWAPRFTVLGGGCTDQLAHLAAQHRAQGETFAARFGRKAGSKAMLAAMGRKL
jgi:hypothetical protein